MPKKYPTPLHLLCNGGFIIVLRSFYKEPTAKSLRMKVLGNFLKQPLVLRDVLQFMRTNFISERYFSEQLCGADKMGQSISFLKLPYGDFKQ